MQKSISSRTHTRNRFFGAAAAVLLVGPLPAWAQTSKPVESGSPAATDAATDNGPQIDDIVVTAEKRDSTVQKTAAALTVISADVLDRQRLVDVKDLNSVLPNVQIVPVVNSLQIAVRGIGSTFLDPSIRPGRGLRPSMG